VNNSKSISISKNIYYNKYFLYIVYKWVKRDLGILGIIGKNGIFDILNGALVERDIKVIGDIVSVVVVIKGGGAWLI